MKRIILFSVICFLLISNSLSALAVEKSKRKPKENPPVTVKSKSTTGVGEAISFDVLNSYLTIPNNASFNVSEFTIETWFKWQATGGGADFICSKSGALMEIHTNDNNSIRFIPVPGLSFDTAPNTISQYTWIHLACVYKPSIGLAKVYINGVDMALTQLGVNPITTPISADTNPMIIGSRGPNANPFLGKINDLRIWNRALTQADIQHSINCEIPTIADGLIVNHHFNQGIADGNNTSITILTDSSGFNNDATLVNFTMNGTTSNLVTAGSGTVQSGIFCSTEVSVTTDQTLCNGATISDLAATGTNLKWYNAIAGGTSLNPLTTLIMGNYYVSQTISGLESARVVANVAINTTPIPTAIAQALNTGDTIANLSATGTDIKWYDVATNGVPLIPTTVLVNGAYYATQTLNSCESERLLVNVSITTVLPTTNDQSFCTGATVIDLVATGSTIKWYDVANGGTPLSATTLLTTANYYVSQTINAIESERVLANVTVYPFPNAPTAASQNFCGSSTVDNLTASGSNIKWYDVDLGGTALVSTTSLNTSTYYVSQTTNDCESARTAVNVNVYTIPDAPIAVAQSFNAGATVADLVATGTALKWFDVATGGTPLSASTILLNGNYYVSQSTTECESNPTTVAITVTTALPTASNQIFCEGATVANLVASGSNLKWYNLLSGGTAMASNTILISGNYYVSQTIGGTESARVPVTITVTQSDPAPTGLYIQVYTGTATLSNLSVAGTNIKWYDAPTAGNLLANSTTIIDGTTYYATQTETCESLTRLAVTAKKISESTQTICNSNIVADLVSSPTSGAPASWFTTSTGGTALEANTNLSTGTYYIEQINPSIIKTVASGIPSYGLALDSSGNIYVAGVNGFNNTINKLNALGSVIATYNLYTNAATSIAVDALGDIYYATQNTISKINASNSSINEILSSAIRIITDIAVDGSGNVFYSDLRNNTINKIDASNNSVSILKGGLNRPVSIALDAAGNIYVGENSANRPILKMDGAGNNSVILGNGFDSLTNLKLDSSGNIYVALNYGNNNSPVYKMDSSGANLVNLGGFSSPVKIAIDNSENIFVLNSNGILQKIEKGTASNRVPVSVVITSPPTASAQTFDAGATVANLAATGTTLQWYEVATGGTPLTTSTELVSGIYYVSQTLNSCESKRVAVNVTIIPGNGAALRFDGADDYVAIADNSSFNVNAFTIETWFKWENPGNIEFICGKGASIMEIHTNPDSSLRFIPVSGLIFDGTPNSINLNTWMHLACVYDPNTSLAKMYINGVEISLTQSGFNPITSPIIPNTNAFGIGARIGQGYYYKGRIDEFRLWNRALSQAEIQSFMNCEIATAAFGLIVNQHFNQGIGESDNTAITTITDVSGNANDGTLTNFTLMESTSNFVSVGGVTSGVSCNITIPAPNATASYASCYGSTIANLTATGTALKWYDVATNGSVLTSTTVLSTGYYYVSQTIGGIESDRTMVNVTINTTPTPTAANQSVFIGATIVDLIASGSNLQWYDVATNGTPLDNSNVLAEGTYYVSQTSNGCESIRLAVNVAFGQVIANALRFDGADDYVFVADNASFNVDAFTIETWFKWENPGNIEFICSKGASIMEIQTNPDNSLRFIPIGSLIFDGTPNSITPNTWTHVACVYDPNTSLAKMYINGVEITLTQSGFNPINTPITPNTAPLGIGSRNGEGYYYKGRLDEFRLWNRALSQTEIQNTMNCEIATAAYGLVMNQHFYQGFGEGDNTAITTITDASGNANNGTLVNFALNGITSNLTRTGAITSGVNCTVTVPAPIATASQTLSQGTTASNISATGIDLKWYDVATNGSALASNTLLSTGNYYVSQTIGDVESDRTAISVTINTVPNPVATVQTFSVGATISNLVASGTDLVWYDVAANGTPLDSSTVLATGTYYLTQTLNGCESTRLPVVVTILYPQGAALDFDGINDYLAIANNATFNVNAFTLETWVKWDRSGTIDFICGKGSSVMEIHTTPDNGLRFIPVGGLFFDTPANVLPSGTWTHLACWFNPANTADNNNFAKMYINGVEVALNSSGPKPLNTPITTNTAPFVIGSRSANTFPFLGKIDEFRIWNRPLSQAEILEKMNCEIVNTDSSLIANLHFNQGNAEGNNTAISSILDTSGNNNNAALTNFLMNGNASNVVANGGVTSGTNCTFVLTAPVASAQQSYCFGATVANLAATGMALKWYNVPVGGTALLTTTPLVEGTYYVSQTNVGMESERTLVDVVIVQNSEVETIITACDGYIWANNGQTYTNSGTYTGTTVNCVTQKLILTINPGSENTTTVTACNSYTWANTGETYYYSDIFYGTTTNCVTEVLDLTIEGIRLKEPDYAICQNSTLSVGEGIYSNQPDFTNHTAGSITSGATYIRPSGNNATTYTGGNPDYFKTYSFVAPSSGPVAFEIYTENFVPNNGPDSYLAIYQNSFDPNNPANNFL